MEIEFEHDQLLPVDNPVDALDAFRFIVSQVPHLQLAPEEVEGMDGLLKKLLGLSPSPEALSSALFSLARFYQTFPPEQLRLVEESISSLLLYALDRAVCQGEITHFICCMRGGFPRDHLLHLHGKAAKNSIICKSISEGLKKRLEEIAALDEPLALRIAASCALAGILADYSPQIDC